MPAQKEVILLGNLCADAIAQHLVDITLTYHNYKLKKNSSIQTTKKDTNEENKENEGDVDTQPSENARKPISRSEIQRIKSEQKSPIDREEKSVVDNVIANSVDEVTEGKNGKEIGKEVTNALKGLDTYRSQFVDILTSHANVQMHANLYSRIIAKLNDIYMTKRKTRTVIQEIMQFFINSSLRDLDFEQARMCADAGVCGVLLDKLENASHLRKLVIGRSCYWRIEVFQNLSEKLKSLPELNVLKIHYICTPEMIKGLSDCCPNLNELELFGSEKITDMECEEIAKCIDLKILNIMGTKITGKGCLSIIKNIRTLAWLYHCAFNCNSDALLFESRAQLFQCIKEQSNLNHQDFENAFSNTPESHIPTYHLKYFWLFNPSTEDLFTALLCPDIEHLRLDFIFQDLDEEPDVGVISQISKLNRFEAKLYDRCAVDLLTQMIENCGSKLTDLSLHVADDYFFIAQIHNVVALCCPNLVNLRFQGDFKVDSERVHRARHSLEDCDDSLDFEIPSPAHPHLEHLNISGVVSDSRLSFLWKHSPKLRTLWVDSELEWLHDHAFISLLDSHPLPNLETVWFNVSTSLTLRTVRQLLLHENKIHTIGRLCQMAHATLQEYKELRDLTRQKNFDVKLIWVTDERT